MTQTSPKPYEPCTAVSADGYPMLGRRYAAAGSPRGVVCCFHGIQSHAGWYDGSCRRLAERGYETFFWDRRGSGANFQDRGHAESADVLIDDLRLCVEASRKRHPQLPCVVVGISWGGKLAAVALGQHPEVADGLIMVAPGLAAKVAPSLRIKGAIGWSTLFWPRRLLPIPLADPALFTPNPARQRFIAEDVLSLRNASARLLFTSRVLDGRLRSAVRNLRAPALLMLATQDRIVDNVKTRRVFESFASADKETVELAGGHTLEFDEDPEPFFAAMLAWLDRRCPARA